MTPTRSHGRRDPTDQILAESADLLEEAVSNVEPPRFRDDFLARELSRLLEDGEPSFDDPAFRFLIEQGIRLEYDDDLELRSRFAGALYTASASLKGKAARAASHAIGAIEDTDFPLHRVGAVVRHYTRTLFERVSGARDSDVPALADQVFENAQDPERSGEVISELAGRASAGPDAGVAARVLAHAVSEPYLEESVEDRALEALRLTWPRSRTYILYRLREHTHEDIPFRWMELMIRSRELRAVDRILEEVLVHAAKPVFREDLLTALELLGRSEDPGRTGKILRLRADPRTPPPVTSLLDDWRRESSSAEFLKDAWPGSATPVPDFVPIGQDFSAFARTHAEGPLYEIIRRWNDAYHESLGWMRRRDLPRGDFEKALERELDLTIVSRLASGRMPEEATLRDLVESLREDRLTSADGEDVPLLRIFRERPREDPWSMDVCFRDLNAMYTRASGKLSQGDPDGARRDLDLLLAIDLGQPLASMLDGVLNRREAR